MKEKVIIFKASEEMDKSLVLEAIKRKVSKSELIRACIIKGLNIKEKPVI